MIPFRRSIALLPAACILGLAAVAGCGGGSNAPAPQPEPPAPTAALPADIENQVHTFCGTTCHAYPPADTFPRRHWRTEVERAFRFFDQSGLPLTPPKLGHVVRYYEEHAPDDYPP